MESDLIVNKVELSGLINFNLEDFYPKAERVVLDLKEQLWQGLILKEKDFREFVKTNDWTAYSGKYVAITCTADAIVPVWAYMLLATALQPYAAKTVFGDLAKLEELIFHDVLATLDLEPFRDGRIIIKGCSKYPVPASAYVELTTLLRPVAKSLMYGEACSTVPIYKK